MEYDIVSGEYADEDYSVIKRSDPDKIWSVLVGGLSWETAKIILIALREKEEG